MCQACEGAGAVSSMLGLRQAPCVACEARGYVHARQHACQLCGGQGSLRNWYFRSRCVGQERP